jgi:hypothetical protein
VTDKYEMSRLGVTDKHKVPRLGVTDKHKVPRLGVTDKYEMSRLGVTDKHKVPRLGVTDKMSLRVKKTVCVRCLIRAALMGLLIDPIYTQSNHTFFADVFETIFNRASVYG